MVDGRAGLQGEFLRPDDFFRVHLPQRAAEGVEILRGREHELAVHVSASGDDAVAGRAPRVHPEIGRPRFDEKVDLREAAGVQQQVEPLPGGQLPPGALTLLRRLAAQRPRPGGEFLQFVNRVSLIRFRRQRSSPKSVYCIQSDSAGEVKDSREFQVGAGGFGQD